MSSASIADTDLLKRMARGDSQAVQQLYQDFFPRILAYVRKNNGDEDAARDLFQDALMVLYKKSQDDDFRLQSALFTYLYAICRNLWLKRLKKSDRERVTPEPHEEYSSEDPVAPGILDDDPATVEEARYQLYRRKFRELGEVCQRLLTLSLAGKKMDFIAQELGLSSVGYARKRKFKCKEQLMKRIQSDPAYRDLAI